MPPKRAAAKKAAAAAPPALALDGCTVAISGTFPKLSQAAVKASLTDLGAAISASVNASTTHLVTTTADVAKNSSKVAEAIQLDIPIVSLDWLRACETSGQKEDVDSFLISGQQSTATAAAPATKSPTPAPAAPTNAKGKGKKRAASPAPSPAPDVKVPDAKKQKPVPQVGDSSIKKSNNIVVPLDEGLPGTSYQVYIDDQGIIYDASLNQTNAGKNNNKFYRVQLVQQGGKYYTWTRWGRVGDFGQSAMLGGGSLADALKNYEKKFKDKSGLKWDDRGDDPKKGKYAYVEKSYAPDSDDEGDDDAADTIAGASADQPRAPTPKSELDTSVQSLMQLIFNQQYMNDAMNAMNYDAKKMPLGKLSKATIARGFQALKDLAALINDPTSTRSDIEDVSNRYYSLIPHSFGRNRPPIILNDTLLKAEIDLMDSLSDMKETAELMKKELGKGPSIHPLDKAYRGLGMEEMTTLSSDTTEFQELSDYLLNTIGQTHHHQYSVESIFRIERQGELERFNKAKFNVNSDRRLLWHGSRATNFGGILSQGLRIAPPEAPVSGYMFGKGIYLADMSSKSANYCVSSISGGNALLLLCEAELGDPMQELTNASYNAGETAKQNGSLSTWGKGKIGPSVWKDAECVHPSLAGIRMPDVSTKPGDTNVPGAYLYYNEYIAYDISQVRLRYLLRIKM
ncbi:PARP-domain-containing protein [Amniculicola lignicola CBS 123094]|uniref:Poly [ADP-ribose] polymerase n=1 Tax=Amniculicola lignicola CBS 123094 TaxID=1392246 RepID=A0A6A5WH76_9PLEO|nr:PARP-domain-containing protein [Amniculicola lignicola CBS 123094]